MAKRQKFTVISDYDGIGSVLSGLTHGIGLDPKDIVYKRIEWDNTKNKLFDTLHPDILDTEGYEHVIDTTSPEAMYLHLRNMGFDAHFSASVCHGLSKMQNAKKGFDDKGSGRFKISHRNKLLAKPKTSLHEMVLPSKGLFRDQLDLLHKMGDVNELDEYDYSPEMTEELLEKYGYRPNMSYKLPAELWTPGMNTHVFHTSSNWELPNGYRMSRDPEYKRHDYGKSIVNIPGNQNDPATQGDIIFDPNIVLNRKLRPDDDFFSLYQGKARKRYNGILHSISAKNVPGRITAQTHIDSPTAIRHLFDAQLGGYGHIVDVMTPEEQRAAVKDRDPSHVYWSNNERYRGHPSIVVSRLSNQSRLIDPKQIYKPRSYTPREAAVIMGYPAKVGDTIANTDTDRKTQLPSTRVTRAFGDTFPVQTMTYLLLHNPILWKKFPEQMKAALEKFNGILPSDERIKDLAAGNTFKRLVGRYI